MLAQAVSETENYCYAQEDNPVHAPGSFLEAWPVDTDLRADTDEARPTDTVHAQLDAASRIFRAVYPWSFGLGLLLGFVLYLRGFTAANLLLKLPPLRFLHTLLRRRLFLDDVIASLPAQIARLGGQVETHQAGAPWSDCCAGLRTPSEPLAGSGNLT